MRDVILYGTKGQKLELHYDQPRGRGTLYQPFEGVANNLERRYQETQSDASKREIEEFMTQCPCPACKGRRLRPEALAVTVGDLSIMEATELPVDRELEFFNALTLTPTQQLIAAQILKEIRSRLGFLQSVGLSYLTLSRSSGTLSGGESQRIRLATQIGSSLMGVLYILEKGDSVHSMADLRGKTIYATGQGANPEYVLDHLLTANGVDPSTLDIQWMTAQEVSAKMVSSEQAICMLPVPAATALMVQDTGVRQALSLSDEWEKLDQGVLPMGCVVARTEFIQENPMLIDALLDLYGDSITFMTEEGNAADGAALVAKYGIAPNEQVAQAAIPQCNLTFLTGQEMRAALEGYYAVLFRTDPASIGGGMPYDAFYYGGE